MEYGWGILLLGYVSSPETAILPDLPPARMMTSPYCIDGVSLQLIFYILHTLIPSQTMRPCAIRIQLHTKGRQVWKGPSGISVEDPVILLPPHSFIKGHQHINSQKLGLERLFEGITSTLVRILCVCGWRCDRSASCPCNYACHLGHAVPLWWTLNPPK